MTVYPKLLFAFCKPAGRIDTAGSSQRALYSCFIAGILFPQSNLVMLVGSGLQTPEPLPGTCSFHCSRSKQRCTKSRMVELVPACYKVFQYIQFIAFSSVPVFSEKRFTLATAPMIAGITCSVLYGVLVVPGQTYDKAKLTHSFFFIRTTL